MRPPLTSFTSRAKSDPRKLTHDHNPNPLDSKPHPDPPTLNPRSTEQPCSNRQNMSRPSDLKLMILTPPNTGTPNNTLTLQHGPPDDDPHLALPSPVHRPVLQQEPFVDVYGLWIVGAHVVNGGQAQLVLCHILKVLVETHKLLLIIELRHQNKDHG